MDYSRLTVCIPAFNEEQAIKSTLEELVQSFPGAEIIVVNDGSEDNTEAEARSVNGVRVLNNGRNMGYGASLKNAIRHSSRKVIAWYDADGQHRPEDLANVVAPVLEDEKDAVIGVRGADSDKVASRVPGKKILKFVAELVAQAPVPDLNSGLRCFRKNVVVKYLHLFPEGFSASSTTTLLMMKRGYRLGYVSIRTKQRVGKSSVKMLRDGWLTLQLILRILILFGALNFFIGCAAIQVIPALAYGITLAVSNGQGFPVLASTFFISGLLTFFMGIICDQVTSIRKERFERNED
ncbi:MAG: glycosyltransferase family 2 protein [Desulfovibrio sp.]